MDRTEKILYWSSQAALAGDMLTTYDIANSDCYETNPLIGKHPSDFEVTLLWVGGAVGNHYLTRHLEPPYRKAWSAFFTAVEVGMIGNNLSLGLGFSLP